MLFGKPADRIYRYRRYSDRRDWLPINGPPELSCNIQQVGSVIDGVLVGRLATDTGEYNREAASQKIPLAFGQVPLIAVSTDHSQRNDENGTKQTPPESDYSKSDDELRDYITECASEKRL